MYISILSPVFNEEEVIEEFYKRVSNVLKEQNVNYEIMFVNDGSSDKSLEIIKELSDKDEHIAYINLSRNFGKEYALSAGLDLVEGDAVIIIDVDLQDPPELIPEMLAKWQEGYDTVYARRLKRTSDTLVKRKTAEWFYNVIGSLSRVTIPSDVGDFRLISKRSVLALRAMPEANRFMKGLFSWIGYNQTEVCYERPERFAGNTKFNYWKLWNFALDGITAFSTLPLRLASYFGLLLSIAAFCYGIVVLAKTALYGDPVAGYPSLMVVVLFLGGLQLTFLGILGEYLGRMFDESKRRPLYLVETFFKSKIHTNKKQHQPHELTGRDH